MKWTGVLFTIWGVIALFVSNDELLDRGWLRGIRLLIAILIVIGIFLFVYIGVVKALKINQINLLNVGNNHHIYVQYGDDTFACISGKRYIMLF